MDTSPNLPNYQYQFKMTYAKLLNGESSNYAARQSQLYQIPPALSPDGPCWTGLPQSIIGKHESRYVKIFFSAKIL